MERSDYVIRDQEERAVRPLDLLQAFGPPLRPPLRVQVARWLIRVAARLDRSTTGSAGLRPGLPPGGAACPRGSLCG